MRDIQKIIRVIECIEAHVSEKLDLATISQETCVSRFHLHRLFTRALGLTIHDYSRRRRLTEAARLLTSSNTPIIEIALAAGYENQQAFTKVFKCVYKYPPNLFRKRKMFYPLQLPFRFAITLETLALSHERKSHSWKAAFANEADIPAWMELVCLVIDGFPCLEEDQYLQALKGAIGNRQAMIVRDGGIALGVMIFSRDSRNIDFLGIHPLFRNRNIAQILLEKARGEMPAGRKEMSITTYREGDKADTGYRESIKRMGFVESELLYEYGYPTQKFLLS